MNTPPAPGRRPRIVVRVQTSPGRHKASLDLHGGSGDATVPTLAADAVVRVDVGTGLRLGDLPTTITFAHSVRHVGTVQIIGRSQRAVDEARRAFRAAWELDVADTASTAGPAARWAALMLARPADGQSER